MTKSYVIQLLVTRHKRSDKPPYHYEKYTEWRATHIQGHCVHRYATKELAENYIRVLCPDIDKKVIRIKELT